MSESNGYIGRSPGDSSIVIADQYFQPTGSGKTFTFTAGYDPGYVDVYRNGVKLVNVLDYAATDGKNVVLETPVGVGSTVQVVAYKAFNLGNIDSSTADFTVGSNLYVQSGFGSFAQGITANQIDVSGIGTIGIGSFVDIHVSGGATVAATLVANAFSGDGSLLTNVSGIVTSNIVSVAITTKDINVSAAATFTGIVTTTSDLYVGDSIDVAKDLKVGAASSFTGIVTTTSDLYVGDSIDVAKDALVGAAATIAGVVKITDSTSSTSTSTGALIVSGGAGIAGDVWIGAGLSVAGTLTHEDVTSIDSVGMVTAKNGVNITGGELTVGSGITMGIAGVATFSGTSDIHLLDSVQLNVGDGSDLKIYHNGSHSYADNGTGSLFVRSDAQIYFQDTDGNRYADFVDGGAVKLYYNNAAENKRFETAPTGAIVTGILTATSDIKTTANIYGAQGHFTDHIYLADKIVHTGDTNTAIRFPANDNISFETAGSSRLKFESGGDISIYGTAAGVTSAYWDASANSLIFKDDSIAKFGDGSDLEIYHQSDVNYIKSTNASAPIQLQAPAGEVMGKFTPNGSVDLYYDNSKKFQTTNEGIEVTGFTTTTAGMGITGGLFEGAFIKAGKLSDNKTLGISTANIFYFTTEETTTCTPNIVWNDTYALSSKMAVGDVATVTVITTADASGYSANWQIDGNNVTEEWIGGSAPSEGGSDGLDIYTFTIIRKASGTGDTGWKVIGNLSNAT